MKQEETNKYQKKILTIPNLLSLFRLLLIPVIVWLYFGKKDLPLTTLALVISGLTDLADGWIARHFHMVSDLGKMLDPVADKLTQIAMLACLLDRFPYMAIPLIILVVKEIFAAVTGLITIHKTKAVMGAVWHGKVATTLLYAMMILHLIWPEIPPVVSNLLISLCVGILLLSLVLYAIRNWNLVRESKREKQQMQSR